MVWLMSCDTSCHERIAIALQRLRAVRALEVDLSSVPRGFFLE
jgi:hypothetical protein